ncbi:MAG: hypothetical protein HDT30_14995 [Clostridiales bacterium]|nr:hypothetical protein [Clostridiales bacterium]
MAKRKILSCALATLLGLSTVFGSMPVAPSYLTDEAVAAVKEITTANKEQEVVVEDTQVNAGNYGLTEYTKDGAILHAFCWSFNTIKQNMEDIAAAGYSTVQTSPINECLAGEGGGMQLWGNGKWYYHYQPTDWVIGNYQLGTREEYKAMCEEADKYGIKIISDVLPNHTTPTLNAVSDNLANAAGGKSAGALYHSNGFNEIQNYGDRYECTLGQMGGLPDVNTENQGFQAYYLKFCNDVIACGGDGFRYDTAKHIGVHSDPKDASNTRGENDFWDIATGAKEVNGIKLNRPDNFFIYGEVLQDNGIPYDEYASYMNMTASSYGYNLRSALGNYSLNTGSISDWAHATPNKIVTWVESHDTYCNEHESAWMKDWQIRAGWAIIAARGNGTPLFFSRPDGSDGSSGNYWGNNQIGAKGNDQFKHPEVAACNHFRNAMVGESEYLSNPNGNSSVLVIERGTKGAVIINMGSDASNIHMNKMADGTYLEEVSGKEVQVSGGTLNYTVPGGTIAVVYSGTTVTKNPSVSVSKDSGTFTAPFELTLTPANADKATYSINGGDEVSFTKATKVTIGEGCEIGDKVTVKVTATGEGDPFSKTYTYTMAETPAYKMYIRVKKSDFSGVPTLYLYDSADKALNGAWPGNAMTAEGDYYTFTSDSLDNATAILVCGDWRSTPDMAPGLAVSGYAEYDKASNTFKTFTLDTPKKTTAPTKKPIETEKPKETEKPSNEAIQVSVADKKSFEEETLKVKITLSGETKGTYTVDDGPEREFKSGDTVTLGEGKIADTDVTLKVKAGSKTKTFTYKKVFNEEKAVVKSAAISRIQNLFEVVADAAEVNASAETGGMYATNPNGGVGKEATITIDGSFSDWSEDMLIAQGGAWDIANNWKGGHENCVLDDYALYAAWDNDNLYIGWQMVNTTDTWAREGDGPLSDGGRVLDVPLMLAINVGNRPAMTGKMANGKLIWDALDVSFETRVDNLLLMSGKVGLGTPGYFIASDEAGGASYDADYCLSFKDEGISYKMAEGCLPSSIMMLEGSTSPDDAYDASLYVDAMSKGHNTKYDSFYEINIPLKTLGIDKSYIEENGIGVMQIATRGTSGIDCLPHDPSMLDNATGDCAVDPSTSHEKDDADIITVPLAAVGNAKAGGDGGNVVTKPTTAPKTEAPKDTETPKKTETPTESKKYTVNFGADYSSPQYDSRKLTLKAIPYNGEGEYTYEFSIDGEVVQDASSKATYSWKGEAGKHTIKVVVEDESGKKITSEKNFEIQSENGDDPGSVTKTDAPKNTEKPKDTDAPKKTDAPKNTEKPKDTETPRKTNTPAPTQNTGTQKTSTPPTQKPVNTPSPTGNNGSQGGSQQGGDKKDTSIVIIVTKKDSNVTSSVAGKKVVFYMSATGGTGKLTYKIEAVNSSNKKVVMAVKNSSVYEKQATWTPTKMGTYTIRITVTDEKGYYNTRSVSYKITTPVKVKKFKASKSTVKKNKKVTFTVNASSISKVKYRFKLQKVGSKTIKTLRGYSTKKTYTWKASSKGKYYVYLQVKDADGNTKQVKKKITVK